MRRRGKKEKEAETTKRPPGYVWAAEDDAALQKMIDPLNVAPRIEPLGCLGSESRGLLCTPKGEVYERVLGFLTTLNVMAGLVLGAIAGLVQSPLDVQALPQEKRVLGEIYNVLAYFSVTNQIVVVMFSTYVLFILYSHGHTPEIIYRSLTYSGSLFGAMMLAVYIPLLAWLAMMILTAHIYFSPWPKWICTAIVGVTYLVFHLLFVQYTIRSYPRGMWPWLLLVGPWNYCSKRARSDAERFSSLYMASASSGVLAGKDEDHDGSVDADHTEPTPEELQLLGLVDAALPQLGETSAVRRSLLLRALVAEGLTRERLAQVARMERGFEVLLGLLDLDQDEHGLHLTRGERVALALATLEGT